MKNKKLLYILILILFLFLLSGYLYFKKKPTNEATSKTTTTAQTTQTPNENNFLLTDYPVSTVPLYKVKMISSSKYFVNDDPANASGYFGKPVNYYNIVFETEATPDDFISYYRSLMSETNENLTSEERVEGVIGKYKVSASHYGDNPENYGYLQVYLPTEEYQKRNPYYESYPDIVDINEWTEYENGYGLLNQKNGEIEYTQYFPLPQRDEDKDKLIKTYQEKHQLEKDYSYDEKTGLMRWKEGDFSVSLTFSKSHGRIYLVMRKPM